MTTTYTPTDRAAFISDANAVTADALAAIPPAQRAVFTQRLAQLAATVCPFGWEEWLLSCVVDEAKRCGAV